MANADVAYGFKPVNRDGSPYNGATIRCVIPVADGTATFIGDPVKLNGSSVAGAPTVIAAVGGDDVFGVITSFDVDPTNLEAQYRLASTERFCKVATADSTYFQVQDDGTIGFDSAGLNADFIRAAGSTIYGTSGCEIDSTTELSTATLDLQLVAPIDRVDNDGSLANADWIVKFNVSQSAPGRTGV